MQVASKLKAVPKDQVGGNEPGPPDGSDIEIECNVDRPPLIPEGDYTLAFVRAERKNNLWGRTKIFLHFAVLDPGEYHGKVLFMSANIPTNGNFPISSKFLQQWSLAAGIQPRRRDRLAMNVFKGKAFLGHVRTVKQFVHSDKKMKPRDPSTFYSVVSHLIEILAGG